MPLHQQPLAAGPDLDAPGTPTPPRLTLLQWRGGKYGCQLIYGTEQQAHHAIRQQYKHHLPVPVPWQQRTACCCVAAAVVSAPAAAAAVLLLAKQWVITSCVQLLLLVGAVGVLLHCAAWL
jgi:hypothetical protein